VDNDTRRVDEVRLGPPGRLVSVATRPATENRLASATVKGPLRATQFVYDGDALRECVKKIDGSTGQPIVYVGAHYEKNVTAGVIAPPIRFSIKDP